MTFSSAQLTFRHGSILDFSYEKDPQRSAIVNPANQACLGGGGLDAAVNKAGGPQLQQARRGLPILQNPHGITGIRCPKGEARVTGPGNYGSLRVPYVIHAVGADYNLTPNREQGDMILQGAYRSALELAESLELEAVAFPLLSGGAFRGNCSVQDVIRLGLDTIRSYPLQYVKHVYVYAFGGNDFQLLQSLARDVSLTPTEISYSLPQVLPQVSEGMYPESSTYTHEPMSTSDAPYSHAPYNPSSTKSDAPCNTSSTNSPPFAVASDVSGSSSTHSPMVQAYPSVPMVQAYPSGVSAADTDPMTSYPQPSAPMALPSAPPPLSASPDIASMNISPPSVAAAPPAPSYGGSEIDDVSNATPSSSQLNGSDLEQLKKVEINFHGMIKHYNPTVTPDHLPNMIALANDAQKKQFYPMPGMNGGYDTHLTCSKGTWKLHCTTWIKGDEGKRPKHAITKFGIQSVSK